MPCIWWWNHLHWIYSKPPPAHTSSIVEVDSHLGLRFPSCLLDRIRSFIQKKLIPLLPGSGGRLCIKINQLFPFPNLQHLTLACVRSMKPCVNWSWMSKHACAWKTGLLSQIISLPCVVIWVVSYGYSLFQREGIRSFQGFISTWIESIPTCAATVKFDSFALLRPGRQNKNNYAVFRSFLFSFLPA